MWETMNPNPLLFVLSNPGIQSFPGQIIETCETGTRKVA
jgi:malic enzyme